MPTPGPLELVIILVIALLILGPGRLPDVGSALGKSLREFRKASSDIQDAVKVDTTPLPPDETAAQAPATPPVAAAAPIVAAAPAPVATDAPVAAPAATPAPAVAPVTAPTAAAPEAAAPSVPAETPSEEVAAAPVSAGPADPSGSENAS
jgi:TatA/E family protein of Tat protein translocase